MSAHTPGPWSVSDLDHATIGPRRIVRVADTDVPQALAVARVYDRSGETEANARLLASAPELLAALKALVAEVEDKDNPTEQGASEHCEPMVAARAIIAKAEGR